MDQERWLEIERLYNSVLERPEEERQDFLNKSSETDEGLRQEVASLLAESEEQNGFLSTPTLTLGLSLLSGQDEFPFRAQNFGPYKIVKQLGRGGMGEVYLARDVRLNRLIALKILPEFLSRENLNVMRFEQEARAASGVSHPNVAHIYEVGKVDEHHYIAMEYAEGASLRTVLNSETLTVDEAIAITIQVVLALGAAHASGIIHRDIKPENIIIRNDGVVKVVDFGLAKLTEPPLLTSNNDPLNTQPDARTVHTVFTSPGMLMGTVNYMSPEQARGQDVDRRSDIWSCGVVFYELLAGRMPFVGVSNSDVIAEILRSDPPELPADFRDFATVIVRKALSKNTESRYNSALELLEDLHTLRKHLDETGLSDRKLSSFRMAVRYKDALAAEFADRSLRGAGDLANERRSNSAGVKPGNSTAPTPGVIDTNKSRVWSLKSVGGLNRSRRIPLIGVLVGLSAIIIAMAVFGFVRMRGIFKTSQPGPPQINQLTNDGNIVDAAISGDSTLLAYVSNETGQFGISIRNLKSGEKWQLLSPDPALRWGLRFTPNGQSLLYIATQPNSTIGVLYRIPIRGGASQKLVVNIDSAPGISPDGVQFAFIRRYPAQHRDVLIVSDIDGSAEREVNSRPQPDDFSFAGVSWSPDRKLIAVGAGRSNETEFAILGVPLDGGTPVELTSWQWGGVGGAAWDNDGRHLIFSARLAGTQPLQLWRLAYPEKTIERITNDTTSYEAVTLSQGDKTLVSMPTYELSNLWKAGSAGEIQQLTSGGRDGSDGLTITPSGRVIFTVGEEEQDRLWTMNLDGSDRRPLIDNQGFTPSVSPDGKNIVYVSTNLNAHHIWLVGADGQNNRQLTDGSGERYPGFTPDGEWVIYASIAKNRGTLWKISTSGGQPIQIPVDGIAIKPVVSPDGSMIACTYRVDETDKWKIAILPIAGGTPTRTFALPYPHNQFIRWSPDSGELIYTNRQNGVHNLWRQPIDERAPGQITSFTQDQIYYFGVVNNGSDFLISRGGKRRDITLIKNFD